jgi:hypothetical protein
MPNRTYCEGAIANLTVEFWLAYEGLVSLGLNKSPNLAVNSSRIGVVNNYVA